MASTTSNYNFLKPAGGDFVNEATQLNNNWDEVDTQLKANADASVALDTRVDSLEASVISTSTVDAGSLGITAASGWGSLVADGYRIGKLRNLMILIDRTGSNIAAGANSNISDTDILNAVLPTSWRPTTNSIFMFAFGADSFGQGIVRTTGQVTIQSLHTGNTITNGTQININCTYHVA